MSIKLMSAIFETEMRDLEYIKDGEYRKAKASTAKLVLLALADHANDYGESSYPGYDRLEIKTALSRQGISDTLEALKHNGLLTVSVKSSRLGTNDYTINIRAFPPMFKEAETLPALVKPLDSAESSHLTHVSQATRPESSGNHHSTTNQEEGNPIFALYLQEIGLLTPLIADAIQDWEKDVPQQWLIDAIHEAAHSNARNWKYIDAILKRWKAQGNQEPAKKPVRNHPKPNKAAGLDELLQEYQTNGN